MNCQTKSIYISLASLSLFSLTLLLYWPACEFNFINYDDPTYVGENVNVQNGLTLEGIRWAFTTGHASNWHPLTWLTLMADVQFFGTTSAGHHLVNILVHAINAGILFLLLRRMTGEFWPSLVVAGLFAGHPLHVESVAWISERKDVLSTLCWLLTLWFYVRYTAERENARYRRRAKIYYLMALGCLAAGLLSKPMLVTVPFVLLLLDYWPLNRVSHQSGFARWLPLIKEKLPFFAMVLASCVVTFLVQNKGGAVVPLAVISLEDRVINATVAYAAYLSKMVWPVELAVFYPRPNSWPVTVIIGSASLLIFLTWLAFRQAKDRPYVVVGWLWYLGTLVPVSGLVQVGDQAYADRYTYVPLIGIFLAVTWSLQEWADQSPRRRLPLWLGFGLVVACLVVMTRRQLDYWRNGEPLFVRALEVTKNNYAAHNYLGNIFSDAGKLDEAESQYLAALAILPDYEDAHLNLGRLYIQKHNLELAVSHFELAVRFQPRSAEAHYNLGTALGKQKRYAEAVAPLLQAVVLHPDHAKAQYNLGLTFIKLGRWAEAERHFREVLRVDPISAFARHNLGLALVGQNKWKEGRTQFEAAVQMKPDFLPARNELGNVMMTLGQLEEAVEVYEQVLRIDPKNAQAHNNLGMVLIRLKRAERAIKHFSEVARLEPENADAHYNLANAFLQFGWKDQAAFHYAEVLRLNPQDGKAREKLDKLRGNHHETGQPHRP